MSDVAFFLPTRKGSQRVQNKNTKPFCGIEGGLLALKLNTLIQVPSIDTIILSTNDPEAIRIGEAFLDRGKKIEIIRRPDSLASSDTLVEDLIRYVPTVVKHKHIFWTHVTAPFIEPEIYERALNDYFQKLEEGYDSLLSVTAFQQFLWSEDENDIINCDRSVNKWPNTQDLNPLYEINHAFYISSRENYLHFNDRIGQKPYLFQLDKISSIDIDTSEDFQIAEAIFDRRERINLSFDPVLSHPSIDPQGPIRCFLPCRKGSERVKNKNIRPFASFDKGLVEVKLNQLLKVKEFDEIMISTNDEEIIEFCTKFDDSRLLVDRRRDELCKSSTSTDELISYVPEIIKEGHVLWTHVTSPFINEDDYTKAIRLYRSKLKDGYDSLMSVSRVQKFLFEKDAQAVNFNRNVEKWPRTQTITPYFESNSGYFIGHISIYQKLQDRIGQYVYMDEVDKLKSYDIDWEEDFLIAETIYKEVFSDGQA